MLYRTNNTLESVPLVYFNLNGDYLGEFDSINQAERSLKLTNLVRHLNRVTLRCGNYIFLEKSKYKENMRLSYKGLKTIRKFKQNV